MEGLDYLSHLGDVVLSLLNLELPDFIGSSSQMMPENEQTLLTIEL